jgi:hypothetical protein
MTLRMLCALNLIMLGLARQAEVVAAADQSYDAPSCEPPDRTRASLCVTVKPSASMDVAFRPNCKDCWLCAAVILAAPDDSACLPHVFVALHPQVSQDADSPRARSASRPNSRAPRHRPDLPHIHPST